MKPLLVLLAALPLLAPVSAAAPSKKDSALERLLRRVSNYLNAEPVRQARISVAVAAVRGGIPTDQGEDLDQRLLDRVHILRQRLLSAPHPPDDQKALREIYRSLAVSQWVQSLEIQPAGGSGAEAIESLKSWAQRSHAPEPPKELKSLLLGQASGLGGKALVDKGWGRYCRDLTPALAGGEPPAAGTRMPDPETARLDETLQSLQQTWLEKKLTPAQEAQAHFLAGGLYAELAKASYTGVEGPASALPQSPPAGPNAAPSRSAPRRAAPVEAESPAPEFAPRKIYAKASKAVVLILCAGPDGAGELGSGSVINSSGRVLTNAHVVIRDSTRQPWPGISVYLKPQKMTGDPKTDLANPLGAKVVSWDRGLDLALIQLENAPDSLATLSLGDPESVSVGDRVAAIGHPEQGGLWTLTTGVVSTLVANLGGVRGKNAFQTDASINRGNSGGPLLNSSGDIIGVNTLMSRKAADGLAITAVNFAVRSDVAKQWIAKSGIDVAYAAPEASPAAGGQTAAGEALSGVPQPKAAPPPAGPVEKSAPHKREMISESKPYDRDRVIQEGIKEMENLEEEMHEEVIKRFPSK